MEVNGFSSFYSLREASGGPATSAQTHRAVSQNNEVDYLNHMPHFFTFTLLYLSDSVSNTVNEAAHPELKPPFKFPIMKQRHDQTPCKAFSELPMCIIFDGCNCVSLGVRCGFLSCLHTHTEQYTVMYYSTPARSHLSSFFYLWSCSQVYLNSWIILLCDTSPFLNSLVFSLNNQLRCVTCYSVSFD